MTNPTTASSLLLVAGLVLPAACGSAPPQPAPWGPRAVLELDRWAVRADGRLLGHLVRLRIDDPLFPQELFRVENEHGQWVGHVSEVGRFSRRVPFRDGEEDLGIYPMAQGLALLFEVEGPVHLEGGGAIEAAGARRRDP